MFVIAHSVHLLEPLLFGAAVLAFAGLVVRERRRSGPTVTTKESS